MLRRYLLPCALIMVVSIGTAGLAYKGAANNLFTANCAFQAVIQLTQSPPITSEAVAQYNTAASREVSIAKATDVFTEAAKKHKANAADIAGRAVVGPIMPGLATYVVGFSDTDPKRATTLSNAICDEFVASIQRHRTAEVNATVKAVQTRLTGIEGELKRLFSIPKKRRTVNDIAQLIGQSAAQKANVQLLATLLSYPPDNISVLTRAVGAQRADKRSLSKNLIIALLAGLLVCFLVVLVGETIAEGRKRAAASS